MQNVAKQSPKFLDASVGYFSNNVTGAGWLLYSYTVGWQQCCKQPFICYILTRDISRFPLACNSWADMTKICAPLSLAGGTRSEHNVGTSAWITDKAVFSYTFWINGKRFYSWLHMRFLNTCRNRLYLLLQNVTLWHVSTCLYDTFLFICHDKTIHRSTF